MGDHRLQTRWLRNLEAEASAPTLVFLHEGLGSIAQWKDFPEHLARRLGLSAFLYERRGYGRSSPALEPRRMDYLEREACEALPDVLSRAGIERPILVGHSDGGTIALLFAARFPSLPVAMIVEAPHVFLEPITLKGLRQAAEAYEHGRLKARLTRFHGAQTEAVFRGWNETWLHPDARHWNVTAQLHGLRAPLLLIQGEDDAYGSEAQLRAIAAQAQGHTEQWMIPHCGHAPHLEAQDAVLARVTAFLESAKRPRNPTS